MERENIYSKNGDYYEGNWENDLQDGFSVEQWNKGSIYKGFF